MAKAKTIYVCTECGGQTPKWQGQCPHCMEWNTLIESVAEAAVPGGKNRFSALASSGKVQMLSEVEAAEVPRTPTGIEEFDRGLGGGLVQGAVVLIGGDPGIGKSTLLLQAFAAVSRKGLTCLYVSGEESPRQIKMRAERLGIDAPNLLVLSETSLERIIEQVRKIKPGLLVIDSIQTIFSTAIPSAPGSIAQVRESAGSII